MTNAYLSHDAVVDDDIIGVTSAYLSHDVVLFKNASLTVFDGTSKK